MEQNPRWSWFAFGKARVFADDIGKSGRTPPVNLSIPESLASWWLCLIMFRRSWYCFDNARLARDGERAENSQNGDVAPTDGAVQNFLTAGDSEQCDSLPMQMSRQQTFGAAIVISDP
jgi:hypothetical protein